MQFVLSYVVGLCISALGNRSAAHFLGYELVSLGTPAAKDFIRVHTIGVLVCSGSRRYCC